MASTPARRESSLAGPPQSQLIEVPVLRKDGPSPNIYLHDSSALDTAETASISSLELASLRVPGFKSEEHVRRRASELSRVRPAVARADSDAIELTPIPPFDPDRHAASITGATNYGQSSGFGLDNGNCDVEIGPSIAPSAAISIRTAPREDETSSTAPVISAQQRKQQRTYGSLHFFALSFSFFLQGWNDGTTGPLLPTIQRHYNGYISGAVMNVYFTDKIGFGKASISAFE
ncbi:hypothetical protein EIP86_002660 [Pleurotus ostreatoroseus]|nr:hypothetical protein EIP86_002660 [Pleurotus ostreatoroseus]